MELILAIVLGTILLLRFGREKVGNLEYELNKRNTDIRHQQFESQVIDEALWEKVTDDLYSNSNECLNCVNEIFRSIPELADVQVRWATPTDGNKKRREDFNCYNRMMMENVIMASHGKLPPLSTISIDMHPINLKSLTIDQWKAYARWIQNSLREHGVECQIVAYHPERYPKNHVMFQWEWWSHPSNAEKL